MMSQKMETFDQYERRVISKIHAIRRRGNSEQATLLRLWDETNRQEDPEIDNTRLRQAMRAAFAEWIADRKLEMHIEGPHRIMREVQRLHRALQPMISSFSIKIKRDIPQGAPIKE